VEFRKAVEDAQAAPGPNHWTTLGPPGRTPAAWRGGSHCPANGRGPSYSGPPRNPGPALLTDAGRRNADRSSSGLNIAKSSRRSLRRSGSRRVNWTRAMRDVPDPERRSFPTRWIHTSHSGWAGAIGPSPLRSAPVRLVQGEVSHPWIAMARFRRCGYGIGSEDVLGLCGPMPRIACIAPFRL